MFSCLWTAPLSDRTISCGSIVKLFKASGRSTGCFFHQSGYKNRAIVMRRETQKYLTANMYYLLLLFTYIDANLNGMPPL